MSKDLLLAILATDSYNRGLFTRNWRVGGKIFTNWNSSG
jgi:hypothetical protein